MGFAVNRTGIDLAASNEPGIDSGNVFVNDDVTVGDGDILNNVFRIGTPYIISTVIAKNANIFRNFDIPWRIEYLTCIRSKKL